MDDEWSMEEEHLSSDEVNPEPEVDAVDHLETYEINTGIVSDTFRLLRRKAEKNAKSNRNDDHVSGDIDYYVKRFVVENVRDIDYRDLAKLTKVKPLDMKTALSQMGVKVPVEGAKRWDEVVFKDPESPEECAKCAVQTRHSTFYAGMTECRQCFTENIEYWIEESEIINIKISDRL